MKFIVVTLGLSMSNFIYQIVQIQPDYDAAVERSFFQAWAILMVWLVL